MLSTFVGLNLCLCCLFNILKLEVLEALPINLETESEKSVSIEDNAKNSTITPGDVRETLASNLHDEKSKNFNDSADIEALPVLANSGVRKVRSMGGLAPGVILFPINAGYPEEADLTGKRKSMKNRLAPAKNGPKFRAVKQRARVRPKELTISIPSFKTDALGKWVYNPWGATFGRVWQDTRFHVNHQSRMPRLRLESNPGLNYYPDDIFLSSVCLGRTTVYNRPKVLEYLEIREYKKPHVHRPIFMALRRELYKKGKSEECHKPSLNVFLQYQNCALRRNQRMEYYLPYYPRHQGG